ncbi:hypothetical protein [Microbispora sp. NPDC049125]|uniref:hypothetical protein n=1 Tax=Microbispora sp. NPDC049125 TaxID=3154929 RepID=UPI003467C1DD
MRGSRGPLLGLAAVALAYTAIQLAVTARIGLGWDESIYASQVAHGVPAADFSAPRARGVPLLLAPVALFTPSVTALRVYLSLLSGTGLFMAYLPWLRLRRGFAVPLAAAMFAGLWLSLLYGNQAMPNLWVAFSAVAGTGLFCLARERRGGPPVPARRVPARRVPAGLVTAGLVTAFAVASLLRPTDASWLALPLVAYGLTRRKPRAAPAVVAGLAIGWAEWCAEAFQRYGGPVARLRAAGADNETGLHFTLGDHLRALDGPLLCRYGSPCGDYPAGHITWFAALLVLAALGVWAARHRPPGGRTPYRRALGLALATGLCLLASYVFTVGYSAPRFLLPAYALLTLPAVEPLCRLGGRRVWIPVITLALAGYATLQGVTLNGWATYERTARERDVTAAGALRDLGVRSPCLIYGHHGVQVGYLMRCASVGVVSRYGGTTPPVAVSDALNRHLRVAVISSHRRPPAAYLDKWKRVRIAVGASSTWYAFLPHGR